MNIRSSEPVSIVDIMKKTAVITVMNTTYTATANYLGHAAWVAAKAPTQTTLASWPFKQAGLIGGPITGATLSGLR
jgi:hypothetical protein